MILPSKEMLAKMYEIVRFLDFYDMYIIGKITHIQSQNELHIHIRPSLPGFGTSLKRGIEQKFPEVVSAEFDWDENDNSNAGTLKFVIDLEKRKLPDQSESTVDDMIYSRPSVFLSGRAIRQSMRRNRK